jgi:streptomycin 6-kinase
MISATLPAKLLRNVAAMGEAGATWLARLSNIVENLEQRWAMQVGDPLGNATEAFVAEAKVATGDVNILKIPLINGEQACRERSVLLAANGRGYARVLRYDETSGSLLLERLGPQLHQLGYPIKRQIEIICETLIDAWRVSPSGLALPTGAEKATTMAATVIRLSSKFARACSEHTIEVAARFAKERAAAFDAGTSVLGHGDAHSWNTLVDPETGGFRFVDPDGLFIERAHELSISMREWPADLLAGDPVALGQDRCRLLAGLTGVSERAIWQWGLLEILVNGLVYLGVGSSDIASPFLTVAEAWSAPEKL